MREPSKYLSTIILALVGSLFASEFVVAHCGSGTICACSDPPDGEQNYKQGRWFVIGTDNFQICCDESETLALGLARHAETLRRELREKWLGSASSARWVPKCQVVLHSSRRSYTAAIGRGSERTVGSSFVNVTAGVIRGRRIDLLGGQTEFLTAALPHELTHVVLKDRFPSVQLPRWADEGMAMLADTEAKQVRHRIDLRKALAQRTTFNLAALVTMEEYPRSDRWGTFYGESVSLTEFLVEQGSPRHFVRFIDRAITKGYDAALRECYGVEGVAELDREWRQQLNAKQLASNQDG